ncbi:hypothetical protein SDC9_71391 [bioreactor metagenome]|jgi:VanZ family protein|uniref:VanZ-like domain-containing protein n=1 Tax=bioreactor metagenome TaxID=1076179 RepID=A0A644YEE3_9ZZZZ|nr:hypothetical protein [Rikenellaceae bacterium]
MNKIKIIFRTLFVVYLALVFFLSLYSFSGTSIDLNYSLFGIDADKIIHFLMFLPFPFSAWFAFRSVYIRVGGKFQKMMLLVSGLALATITELLQKTTTCRYSDFYDLLANYLAIILGTLMVCLIDKYAKDVWPGRL